MLLPRLIDYYAMAKQVAGCSPKTVKGLRSNLGKFVRFLEDRGNSLALSELTVADARAFIAMLQGTVIKYQGHRLIPAQPGSNYAYYTVWTHARTLRAFSNWLCREGYTKKPVFELLEMPKLPKKKIDVLTLEEIRQVLDAINPDTAIGARLYAIVLLMFDTGIRAGELVGLKVPDVDFEHGEFKVFGKGAKERFVPIGANAKQSLMRYVHLYRANPAQPDITNVFLSVDGCPMTLNAITHIMRRLAKSSGIHRLHAHLLRHTCGVQYLMGGGDTKSLQMILGHSSPFMTYHYEQLSDEHMMAQHRKFSPADALGITRRRFNTRVSKSSRAQPSQDTPSDSRKKEPSQRNRTQI